MNPDLQQFVREALARGASRDQIRDALGRARWPADEIDGALGAWEDSGLGVPVPRRRVQLSAREAFLYLLLFATLYIVAFYTGTILYALITRAFPDPAFTDQDRARNTVRFAVASLIVAFPVFLWTSRHLGRAVAGDPEKRGSAVRRWLTYLTLFVAACVLIGDFIAVLFGFLGGEFTIRFALKASVVAAIAGVLFAHYLGGLRRDESDVPGPAHLGWPARIAGVAVVVVLAIGLGLAGAPSRVRREQLDQRRLEQIQEISGVVQNYHRQFDALPAKLTDVAQTGALPPRTTLRDPQTQELYGYRVVDSLTYELCATFTAPDSVGPWGAQPNEFWRHGVGITCYTFHVPRRE